MKKSPAEMAVLITAIFFGTLIIISFLLGFLKALNNNEIGVAVVGSVFMGVLVLLVFLGIRRGRAMKAYEPGEKLTFKSYLKTYPVSYFKTPFYMLDYFADPTIKTSRKVAVVLMGIPVFLILITVLSGLLAWSSGENPLEFYPKLFTCITTGRCGPTR